MRQISQLVQYGEVLVGGMRSVFKGTSLVLLLSASCYAAEQPEESQPEDSSSVSQTATDAPPSSPQVSSREPLPEALIGLQRVVVAEPYVNLLSGPGRGFPVFYVAERGESVWIERRRNNWFKVRLLKGQDGWINISEMQKMLNPDGSPVAFKELDDADFLDRTWELGFRTGDFDGANLLGVYGAWQFTQNLSAEVLVEQGLGNFSQTRIATIGVMNSPWPEWVVSPHFGVGFGMLDTLPSASLVQEVDRQDEVLYVNGGIKTYITDRFLFRLEYRNYIVLTTQSNNEQVEEWTAGFSVFF